MDIMVTEKTLNIAKNNLNKYYPIELATFNTKLMEYKQLLMILERNRELWQQERDRLR